MMAPASLSALLVCCLSLVAAIPTPPGKDDNSGGTSNIQYGGQSVNSANGFNIQISQRGNNGVCVSRVSILGNGINKTADLPCDQHSSEIINTNKILWVANQYFSDTPKTLVHVTDKQCDMEHFEEKDGKILPSKTETLGADECGKVRAQIAELQNSQQQLTDWASDQQVTLQQWLDNLFG